MWAQCEHLRVQPFTSLKGINLQRGSGRPAPGGGPGAPCLVRSHLRIELYAKPKLSYRGVATAGVPGMSVAVEGTPPMRRCAAASQPACWAHLQR